MTKNIVDVLKLLLLFNYVIIWIKLKANSKHFALNSWLIQNVICIMWMLNNFNLICLLNWIL
jgi:hypothetical protein